MMKTPEPRLPLEPEEYPIYRPPRRIGCSGLSIVTLILLFMFAFLFWRVTPRMVEGMKSFSPQSLLGGDQSTPGVTPGTESNMATQTAEVGAPTGTPVAIATPTPERVCVRVVKQSVIMRTEPKIDAPSALKGAGGELIRAKTGTTFMLVEPDATPVKDKDGSTFKHVRLLPPDGRSGYVLDSYLSSVSCP